MRTQTLKWYTPEEKEPPGDRLLLAKLGPDAHAEEEVLEIETVVWSKPLQILYEASMFGLNDIFKEGCLKEWADTGIEVSPWHEVFRLTEERNAKMD